MRDRKPGFADRLSANLAFQVQPLHFGFVEFLLAPRWLSVEQPLPGSSAEALRQPAIVGKQSTLGH
jgi:hypothetical protein